MKIKLSWILALTAVLLSRSYGVAAETVEPASADAIQSELRPVIEEIRTKLLAHKDTEADFTNELKRFDAIIDKHKSEKSDQVAQAAAMKAMLYMEFENPDKAIELLKKVKQDFPETLVAKEIDPLVANLEKHKEAQKIQANLKIGMQFPDFEVTSLDGKPLSVSGYKGKVLLLDFWATWCGPCVAELPNVLSAYQKYHDKGFEIIGISLDESKPKLTSFLEAQKMTWPQYFDGEMWNNKLATKYGIQAIPATFLLDKEGKIIGKDLRGPELTEAVSKALGTE